MTEFMEAAKINKILDGSGEMQAFSLQSGEPERFHDRASLMQRLAKLRVQDGWIQFTGEVQSIDSPGAVPAGEGVPLCGEFRVDEKSSWHLRWSNSGWSLLRIDRTDGQGLGVRRLYLMDRDKSRRLNYEISYAPVENIFGEVVLREQMFRFAGFSIATKDEEV